MFEFGSDPDTRKPTPMRSKYRRLGSTLRSLQALYYLLAHHLGVDAALTSRDFLENRWRECEVEEKCEFGDQWGRANAFLLDWVNGHIQSRDAVFKVVTGALDGEPDEEASASEMLDTVLGKKRKRGMTVGQAVARDLASRSEYNLAKVLRFPGGAL